MSSNSSTATVLGLKKALTTAVSANQTKVGLKSRIPGTDLPSLTLVITPQDIKDILTQLKTEVKATEELLRVCGASATFLLASKLTICSFDRKQRLVWQSASYAQMETRRSQG